HPQMTILCDWNLNDHDLAPYQVLVLANTACLGDEQAAAVRRFVDRGGGLVASLDTSLFDETGNPRDGFALGDVLGVTYQGVPRGDPAKKDDAIDPNFAKNLGPDYWEKRKGVFDFRLAAGGPLDTPRLRDSVGPDPVTFKGAAVRVAPAGEGAAVAGTIGPKSAADGPPVPSFVTHRFGKGEPVDLA